MLRPRPHSSLQRTHTRAREASVYGGIAAAACQGVRTTHSVLEDHKLPLLHAARGHLSSHGSRMPLNSNVCVSGATTVRLRTCMPEPAEDLHLHILRCSCLPLAASCRNVYVCLLRGAQVRSATRLHHGRTCMAVDVKGDEHGWCARPARAVFRQRTRRACLGCPSAVEHMLCVQS